MQKLKDTFAGFWKYRYLLQNLISRDFKLKYRRSVLGVAWSVLNPLLTCLVMWAVFGALFNQRGQGIEDFPLFLIIGQLMFNFFRESTTMAMESVLKNGPLLRKVYIPKYIFPLEKCCFALVNFFFSLVALFIVALLTWSHISIGTVLLAVYPLVMLFIFSLGIGLILSTLYVFVRDIMHIWESFAHCLSTAAHLLRPAPDGKLDAVRHQPEPHLLVHHRRAFLRHVGRGADPQHGADSVPLRRAEPGPRHLGVQKESDKFVLYM